MSRINEDEQVWPFLFFCRVGPDFYELLPDEDCELSFSCNCASSSHYVESFVRPTLVCEHGPRPSGVRVFKKEGRPAFSRASQKLGTMKVMTRRLNPLMHTLTGACEEECQIAALDRDRGTIFELSAGVVLVDIPDFDRFQVLQPPARNVNSKTCYNII